MSIKKFRESSEFKKYFNNTSWLFVEKILRLFLGLTVSVWVARYFGPDQYGIISYCLSILSFFTAISLLGIDTVIVNHFVDRKKDFSIILGTSFVYRIFVSILLFLFLIVLSVANFEDSITIKIMVVLSGTILFNPFKIIDSYYQSKVQSKYIVKVNLISFFSISALRIYLIYIEVSLFIFSLTYIVDSIILTLGYLYTFFKNEKGKLQFNVNYLRSLILSTWPLLLSSVIVTTYMKVDQIMLKELLTVSDVGQYAAAVVLSESWYFVPTVIIASIFPKLIEKKKESNKVYESFFIKLFSILFWIAVAVSLIVSLTSKPLIYFLYGDKYNLTSSVLIIHIWTSVFVFLGVASSKWFIIENLQKFTLYRVFTGLLINIILNYSLIPMLGVNGAAMATLISQAIASVLFNSFSNKTRTLFILQIKSIFYPIKLINEKK